MYRINRITVIMLVAVMAALCSTVIRAGDTSDISSDAAMIRAAVELKSPMIIDINQTVWQNPEIRYKENVSSKKIMDILEQEGFNVTHGLPQMPTGFIARYGSGSPVIGITAEYDALPGLSQKAGDSTHNPIEGKEFGHGCGHCALGAGAVGAALAVKEFLKHNPGKGTVILYGTPAEESGYGKVFMLRYGCFKEADIIMSWHPLATNQASAWRAIGLFLVEFKFKGTSAHAGAAPDKGRSAVDAAELTNIGVNYLREHITTQARLHYAWTDAGPAAANIVPDHAGLIYYVRAPYDQQRRDIVERVINIARGAALMTGTTVEHKIVGAAYDLLPNPTVAKVLSDAYVEVGGPEFDEEDFAIARRFLDALSPEDKAAALATGAKIEGITPEEFAARPLVKKVVPMTDRDRETWFTASFDLGDVSYCIPTSQIYVAVGIPQTGLHTWQLTGQVGTGIGNKAALAASRALALAAVRFYNNPELVEQAKEDLKKDTAGTTYSCPIPDDITPETLKP